MKRLMTALAIVVLLCVSVFFGYQAFRVRDVRVYGLTTKNPAEVAMLSGIADTDVTFLVSKSAVMERINQNPNLVCEDVAIDWPNAVILTVRERPAMGYIFYNGQYVSLGPDGYIIGISAVPPAGTALISGYGQEVYIAGSLLGAGAPSTQSEALCTLLAALHEIPHAFVVTAIDVSTPTALTITLDNTVTCRLGIATDLAEKFAWIDAVMVKSQTLYSPQQLLNASLDVSSGDSGILSFAQP